MSQPNTPRLGLPGVDSNTVGVEALLNSGYIRLDCFANVVKVINSSTTTPPGSPALYDSYYVPSGGTGAWATPPNAIWIWYNGWIGIPLAAGMMIFDAAAVTLRIWKGSVLSASLI